MSGDAEDPRIQELEAELAAAKRTIDVLIARLERSGTASPTQAELFDAAVRLGNVLEERTREVEDARAEFRALRANLDQIVRQRTRALAESEAQLRTKNIELERQSKIKSDFISIAAHELRTPLTSIVGYLDLFSEGRFGDLPSMLERPISSVRRNAHRLKRLVDDMLDVSRIEAGRMVLRREPVNLGEVVRDVVTELLPLANARHQQIETQIEPLEMIDADRDKMHQIAVNLVSNAIRYTPEQGRITIHVDEAPRDRYPGGWARVRVRDNGVGIAEEDRQRIFDPFLHAQPAKHHTSAGPDSAGLGLYIARGLIEMHGGLITVDSQPEVFTEFTVLLPFKHQVRGATEPPTR
ncbi:MAG TPA: HAMP domain-containing sensor histidine kinase [Kofleriaceae bacterium]|jgi:signal transduction histidine kinase|nr:HAMP domain-containing sensor histidine kinase [Kofleriaceae bacterium]